MPSKAQQVCEQLLGKIKWQAPLRGFCRCPGAHKHTHAEKENDTCVFISADTGLPTITCFHNSCMEEVEEANRTLRDMFNIEGLLEPLSKERREELSERRARERAAKAKALANKGKILERYWPVGAWEKPVFASNAEQVEAFCGLFEKDDLLWVGEPHEVGPEHFYTPRRLHQIASQVDAEEYPHFTTAAVFRRAQGRRCNANVLRVKYFVVEGDSLIGEVKTEEDKERNRAACWAITTWLKEAMGLRLRMVVDSGNKSLHSWFDMPDDPVRLEELKVFLKNIGCDPATFKLSQPVRMPGAVRDDKTQTILWYE